MPPSHNPEIVAFIDVLAETGSHYRMDEMEKLYTEDLGFLVLTPQGEVARFSKPQMMAEFRSRRDAGEKPLSTEKRILHIEEQGDDATAILFRRMSDDADPALYELRLRRTNGQWLVSGETVLPWPDLAHAKGFLPPRTESKTR
jgi:hypothetical protein